ncbi:nickel insertion protein [Anaerovirgula multivorans]|uniref:nickel insertion protein n=1 Tax=Anaerovirgula multivorans TaxID=312168 RepID=UPI002FE5DAB4
MRRYKIDRTILKIEFTLVETKYDQVRVKVCQFEDEKYYYPEYEDIKTICDERGLGFKSVYDAVKQAKLTD